jgi:hypothetical protein
MSHGSQQYFHETMQRWKREHVGMSTDGFKGALDCVLTHFLNYLSEEDIVVDLKWEELVIVAFTVPGDQRTAFRTAFIDFLGNQQHFITHGDKWICELLYQSPFGINMHVTVPWGVHTQNLGKILEDKSRSLSFTRYFSNPRAKCKGSYTLSDVVRDGNAGRSFHTGVVQEASQRVLDAGAAVEARLEVLNAGALADGHIGDPDPDSDSDPS